MRHAELEWLDKANKRQEKLVELKAELEMPSYEEIEELQKKIELLRVRFNELIAWLIAEDREREAVFSLLKVKEP